MEPERFYTHSLRDPRIARILAAALDAVEPAAVVERYLASYPLPPAERVYALGLGKAAAAMTRTLSRLTNLARALVITKHASSLDPANAFGTGVPAATVMESGHPVPDARSLAAGQAALDFVSALREEDLLVCLISGGGSALMTAPRIPLEDMQALTSALLASGARIDEINTLRRRLDRAKGGGIARATKARVLSLILSDVVGSPLEAIASGPTAPDPTTKAYAIRILEKYKLLNQPTGGSQGATETERKNEFDLPDSARPGFANRAGAPLWRQSISEAVRSSKETPKSGDPMFSRVQNVIVGDNAVAVRAALQQAAREGFHAESLGSDWQGEARQVGVELARRLRVTKNRVSRPFCLVAGGETTVTLDAGSSPQGSGRSEAAKEGSSRGGSGGRNQELALAAVPELAGLENLLLISLATDGEDGPTDAAGAVVNGDTFRRANQLGLEVADHLSRHDSYRFFEQLRDVLLTGPTGTNVNDLVFLLGL